jgi:flagellar basal body-associated protein FliL
MAKTNDKKARRELEAKKAKKKQNIMLAVLVIVILAAVGTVVFNVVQSARAEVYANGNAKVTLRPNGNFTATLYHDERVSGTYIKSSDSIVFTYHGETVTAELESGNLHLPHEWDDGHDHGLVLTKQ